MAFKTADEIASLFYDSPTRTAFPDRGLGVEWQVRLTVKQTAWLNSQWDRENRTAVSSKRDGGSGQYSVGGAVKGSWRLVLLPNGAGLLNFREDDGKPFRHSWDSGTKPMTAEERAAYIAALKAEEAAENGEDENG